LKFKQDLNLKNLDLIPSANTIHEELISSCEKPVIRTTASLNDGEGSIAAQAIVGVDLNQKGMQVPQQYGSASSYGKKYALGNLFLIDDTADADATNDHGKKKFEPKKPTLTSKKDPAFNKAVEYIKAGGKVQAIKAKYAISQEVEQALTTL